MSKDSVSEVDLNADIEWAGRVVSQEWPGIIEADDARQEIWVKILESPTYVEQLTAMPHKGRRRALAIIGHRAASRYRADFEVFSANVRYSTSEVRALLEDGALLDDREVFDAAHLDVEIALGDLVPRHSDIITARYARGAMVTDTKAVTRAVDALTAAMNRSARARAAVRGDSPGSRRAMSNASAQAITRNAL
ncbi:MAG: hypothetical protein ABIQ18_27865 [Umezawaea sp.]